MRVVAVQRGKRELALVVVLFIIMTAVLPQFQDVILPPETRFRLFGIAGGNKRLVILGPALGLLFVIGLFRRKFWARQLTLLVCIIVSVTAIAFIIASDAYYYPGQIGLLVIAATCYALLRFNKNIRFYFEA